MEYLGYIDRNNAVSGNLQRSPPDRMRKDEKGGTTARHCCQGTLRYDLKILG